MKIVLIKIMDKDKQVKPDKIYHLLTKLVQKNQEIMEELKVSNTRQFLIILKLH
jgi:hypothetical protein